jgi:hypothetical protein
MKYWYFISVAILLCVLPLALCIVYWMLPLGSIGPMVPITGIANVLLLPVLIYFGAEGAFHFKMWKPVLAVLSLLLSVFLAVLGMNLFMLLTYLFGIKDYQMM